jgi:hypothetical protein
LLLLSYYFVLMPVWGGLIVTMMSTDLDPIGSWLGVPFGLTLLAAAAHLAYFRREHGRISRRFFPYAQRPEVTLPLVAVAFGVFGVVLLAAGLRSL